MKVVLEIVRLLQPFPKSAHGNIGKLVEAIKDNPPLSLQNIPAPQQVNQPGLADASLSCKKRAAAKTATPDFIGAGDGTRTRDFQLGKLTFYR